VLVETLIRELLGLRAHRVVAVEQDAEQMVIRIDRLGRRRMGCRACGRSCAQVHHVDAPRRWQHLSVWGLPVFYTTNRGGPAVRSAGWEERRCPGRKVGRASQPLRPAVAEMSRQRSWQQTDRYFRLDWKSVASIVQRMVAQGLECRRRRRLHILGIDEVSRRKGHPYLTVVYDLERRVLLWTGEDCSERTLNRFFTQLGQRRSATIQVVCLGMWRAYLKAVRRHAQVLFDRFHLVQHLNRAVDAVRRSEMRRLSGQEKTAFKRTRFRLL
jgi:transposase